MKEKKQQLCNAQRIRETVLALANFTDTPGAGVTRFSYSQQDAAAKAYLQTQLEKLGMAVVYDPVGNLLATLEGENPALPSVYIGSHLDSVANGGMFDGAMGVAAALEVCRVMKACALAHRHSLVLVAYAEEEGSNFSCTTLGSKCMLGEVSPEELQALKSADGTTAFAKIQQAGYRPEQVQQAPLAKGAIKAMLECHVEQSIVLERQNIPIGVVQAIAGIHTLTVTVEGGANHAGATPMGMRQDALAAAADIIREVERIAREAASPTSVATVGHIECFPNAANIIPGLVKITVDLRDVCEADMVEMQETLQGFMQKLQADRGVNIRHKTLGKTPAVPMAKEITQLLQQQADELGYPYMLTGSGATHDAAVMAKVADTAMIFVPSKKGISHNPQEESNFEDIEKGANLLLHAVRQLCR